MKRALTAILALALILALGGCQSAQHACRHHGGVSHLHNTWAVCNDGTWHSMGA